ncbi:hypothetical protein HB777_22940 [Mesorhizobium loti]|nr:hypothetical protein HB777_22940 [Mesorhizobium loti]
MSILTFGDRSVAPQAMETKKTSSLSAAGEEIPVSPVQDRQRVFVNSTKLVDFDL